MSEKRSVTETELKAHIAAWPRKLERDVFGAFEPPLVTYNDFSFGKWPESVVASYQMATGYLDTRVDPPVKVEEPARGWIIHRELP